MKFLHLADLHIGKRLNGISLIEDQRYIFDSIIKIIRDKKLDAVVIAGDIYDKASPSAEAFELFDDFLTDLSELDIPIMIISGNHDSPERLGLGGRIMKNIYNYSVFDGHMKCVTVKDVDFYLLPFVRPQTVRSFYDEEISDYDKMTECILADFQKKQKSVLIMHQLVINREYQHGDEINIGTLDSICVSHFKDFDYVAMGHIHESQRIGESNAVYCGAPLKYSAFEADYEKCAVIVDTDKDMELEQIPLKPLHDVRKLKGEIDDLLNPEIYGEVNTDDYFYITLTDKDEIIDASNRLRTVYKNILEIEFERNKEHSADLNINTEVIQQKTPLELFEDFFEEQNGYEMTEKQKEVLKEIMGSEAE